MNKLLANELQSIHQATCLAFVLHLPVVGLANIYIGAILSSSLVVHLSVYAYNKIFRHHRCL
jgi:hypothetical protein